MERQAKTTSWQVKAFVDATPISGPACVGKTTSASLAIALSGTLTIAATCCPCSLAYLRARSSSWSTVAEFPLIQALFDHYLSISGDSVNSSVYTYMGIMHSLRPPTLGGEPELAREFFEKAITESLGNDLNAKLEYARGYAKLMYDRELHDRLLNEVIDANPNHNGFVLTNILAQEEAVKLLTEADDYF